MLKLLIIFYLVFVLGGFGLAAEDNLEVKGKIQTDSLILTGGGTGFPATPVKGEVFYRSDLNRFYTFDGQSWSGENDKTAATKIVAASNSLDTSRADYLCDGTDDQLTIQTAINALGANGGVVYLLEGTYNLSGPITFDNGVSDTIDDSGKSLIGTGQGTLLKLTSTTFGTNIINATNVMSLLISRLSLDGYNISATLYCLFFNNVSFSKIDKLWTKRASASIRLVNSSNNTISNCYNETGSGEISIFSPDYNLIWNNQIGTGLSLASSYQNMILNNNFVFGDISLYNSSRNTVSGNNLPDGYITLRRNSSNNLISHNLIQFVFSLSRDGIHVFENSNNNILLANTISGNAMWGIRLGSSTNNLILANLLSENRGGGIQIMLENLSLWPNPNFNFLSSNRIFSSGPPVYGIDIASGALNTYLSGNLIDGLGYLDTAIPPTYDRRIQDNGANTRYTDKTKLTLEPASACPGAGCSGLAIGSTLTPTGPTSYLQLNPTGGGTITLGIPDISPGKAAGDLLILENISPTTQVRLNRDGTKLGEANIDLGQNDILTLIWDGSFWVEIGYSNN